MSSGCVVASRAAVPANRTRVGRRRPTAAGHTVTRRGTIFAEGPDYFDQLMPSWFPPTPPLSDSENDVYFDDCLDLLYDPEFMTEAQLPSTIYELHRPLVKPSSPVKQGMMNSAVQNEERMTHSIEKNKSALLFNWEYVSGFVNRITGFYRSPRQCSIRYQLAVRPREAGQLVAVDPISKKPKKVPLTQAEVDHLRKGRVTTDLQYKCDAGRLMEAKCVGRMKLVKTLALKRPKCYKRNTGDEFIKQIFYMQYKE
uniref:SANT domain-containing protein n=1 Tax=Heterorhabditis bacteriophora TaxID=37862 RepID=A0A1I7XR45_HETBA